MKEAFEVEEEGFDQIEADQAENLLQEFVDYVKKTKVGIVAVQLLCILLGHWFWQGMTSYC